MTDKNAMHSLADVRVLEIYLIKLFIETISKFQNVDTVTAAYHIDPAAGGEQLLLLVL